jgi:hypothetical protein
MRRGNFIFTIALLMVSLLLLRATLPYPFKAKLFPLIILITVLILLMIQIVREVVALRVKGATEKKRADSFRSKHLTILFWMVGTVLMLWVLGFMGTVILLPFLYLRFEKENWLLSITLSLGCGIFFYGLFGYLLRMPLYPGMILERIFG